MPDFKSGYARREDYQPPKKKPQPFNPFNPDTRWWSNDDVGRGDEHLKKYQIVSYSSEQSHVAHVPVLHGIYCKICGSHAVASTRNLESLPTRSTDGSYVLMTDKAELVKSYAVSGESVRIKRSRGVETQHRFNCGNCSNVLGYRSTDLKNLGNIMWLFKESVTSKQSMAAIGQALET